ncbi:MAG: 1-deoxy-D-xylulose-5-phosphate synthase [Gammaproteobacteria bacterium]
MSEAKKFPLLDRIDSPRDLRRLAESQLPEVAKELRQFLIDSVHRSGGHFAGGLGAVELAVALHYTFDTPEDRIIWDVGHQAYPHKILTGRRRAMDTLRKRGGLSGFPHREESEYDAFGVGHSSTSISAALGMAIAAKLKGEERSAVAVIGDGGMTGGMAYEALNHAGGLGADVLVILNDNEMSISPNVGALSNSLSRILSSRLYSTVREGSERVLRHVPPVFEFAKLAKRHAKGMLVPGTFFEELGFEYFGPVDGHDVSTLVATLQGLKRIHRPRVLHVVTRKGKGFPEAEKDPVKYHAISPPAPAGVPAQKGPTYTAVFGEWLCDMAEQDERLIGITPAMREGSGLVEFSERFPERYFDVGIAEQHALTFAAGAACEGMKPVVAIYSTFLQRAYDQLIHDVALQDLSMLLAIDRGGLVGPDGATHAGSFDLSYLRSLPNLVVMAPADENECRQMLYTGFVHPGCAAVRYPRGRGPGVRVRAGMEAIELGRGEVRREGKRVALLAFGAMLAPALTAGKTLDATVVNMRFVKPLDEALILEMAERHSLLVTVEDNVVAGGAGSGVGEVLAAHGVTVPVLHLGLPDRFIEQGEREELLAELGLDADGIVRAVTGRLSETAPATSAQVG